MDSTRYARPVAGRQDVPPGGGPFSLPALTVGLFLVGQQSHRLAVGSDRKRHLPLAAGEGWMLPAGAIGVCEYDEAHSYLTLQLPRALLDDAGVDKGQSFAPVVGGLDPLLAGFVRNAAEVPDAAPLLYRETMGIAAAAHVARLLGGSTRTVDIEDRRLRRAIAYIHDHIADDLSLDGLAAEAAMSRFHFARAFARAKGKPPLQYVIHERMELAKLRLRATRAPIADIALAVGYEDVSRFGQHFRRHTGTTPGRYRDG